MYYRVRWSEIYVVGSIDAVSGYRNSLGLEEAVVLRSSDARPTGECCGEIGR
jgi:hypothetical protein